MGVQNDNPDRYNVELQATWCLQVPDLYAFTPSISSDVVGYDCALCNNAGSASGANRAGGLLMTTEGMVQWRCVDCGATSWPNPHHLVPNICSGRFVKEVAEVTWRPAEPDEPEGPFQVEGAVLAGWTCDEHRFTEFFSYHTDDCHPRPVYYLPSKPEPERSRLDQLAEVGYRAVVGQAHWPWDEQPEALQDDWRNVAKAILRWLDEDAHRRYPPDAKVTFLEDDIQKVLGFEPGDYSDAQ